MTRTNPPVVEEIGFMKILLADGNIISHNEDFIVFTYSRSLGPGSILLDHCLVVTKTEVDNCWSSKMTFHPFQLNESLF